jgi:vanillate O-demethylase monooxygenase subunit
MTATGWPLAKNQAMDTTSEVSLEGDARIYESLRHFWHPVMYADELGDGPAQATLCEVQLAIVRLDGEVSAFNDLCPHRGTALSLGSVVDGESCQELRCAYHGWQYDDGGRCTTIPQRPDLVDNLRVRVQTFPTVERYGLIWVCLLQDPMFPMAEFPQYDDPRFQHHHMKMPDWNCTSPRRVENYVDLGHFAILHDGFLGQVNHPEIPRHDVWREDHILRIKQLEPNREPVNEKYATDISGDEVVVDDDGEFTMTDQEWWLTMPLTVLLHQTLPGDRHYYLFFHATPLDPGTVRNFTIHARNFGDPDKAQQELFSFSQTIYGQDKPIVESQRPEALSRDLSHELHLQDVDTVALQYRLWLSELVASTEGTAN